MKNRWGGLTGRLHSILTTGKATALPYLYAGIDQRDKQCYSLIRYVVALLYNKKEMLFFPVSFFFKQLKELKEEVTCFPIIAGITIRRIEQLVNLIGHITRSSRAF